VSGTTLASLEAALEAHFRDETSNGSSDERRTAVIINWVVAFTVSNLVEVDGVHIVGYANDLYRSEGDPNAAVSLCDWAAEDVAQILHHDGDDE
jgi:hypothetical protein